jgi:hypothetical protein
MYTNNFNAATGRERCGVCFVLSCAALSCGVPLGVDGTTLKEAKYINLSLHYLEQVIIALQERSMGMGR